MKTKTHFWFYALLVVLGATMAGYSSGRYEGVRSTRLETQQFLRELARETDLETYLQQRGQKQWTGRLAAYGVAGSQSYIRSFRPSSYLILAGITGVAVGLLGLGGAFRGQVDSTSK